MARLKLQPDPTFKAKVGIAVPGAADVPVEFTFKYRDREEMKVFLARLNDPEVKVSDAELIEDMCTGWELTDPFTRESLEKLVLNYIQSTSAIFDKYIDEHTKARAKN